MKVTNTNISEILEAIKKYEEIKLKHKIELGKHFYNLKKEVGHGNFTQIVEIDYPTISKRSIQRYMSAYKKSIGE
jgi:hypothetical protein